MTRGEEAAEGLTRRAMLRGAAVAGAVALVDPGGAVGLIDPGGTGGRVDPRGAAGRVDRGGAAGRVVAPGSDRLSEGVFSRRVGPLAAGRESRVLSAPAVFSLVGVEWSSPATASIELRARSVDGRWSPWVAASVVGHSPDGPPPVGGQFGEPVWTGAANQVQLRASSAVAGVRLHFIAPPAVFGSGTAREAQAMALAQPVLDAGPGQPPIIARGAWARGHAPPRHLPEYGTVKLAFVHHSDGANGYSPGEVPSILLGMFAYHVYVRGYWDIAYNFAVDAFGRIWEARAGGIDLPVMGAHAGGYNLESTGMVVLGTYMNVVPSPAAIGAFQRLLAWKLSLHGIATLGRVTVEVAPSGAIYTRFAPAAHVSLPRVAGHRDGDTTDCPGNAFYPRLPSIRPQVAQLAGTPARLTMAVPAATVNPGASVAVSGQLTQLGNGAPLSGAPIELQQVGIRGVSTTIATATTDGSGDWTVGLTAAQNVMLRALHRPAPAAVSDLAALSVAPAVTLTLDSAAPLQVSGTVSPAGPRVTIDLYRVVGRRRHLVASRHLPAAGGSFAVGLGTRRPGNYVLIASTPANARYAAGASPPVALTIG
jgi:hypothetical protein